MRSSPRATLMWTTIFSHLWIIFSLCQSVHVAPQQMRFHFIGSQCIVRRYFCYSQILKVWIFTTTSCYACTTETWRDRSDVIKHSIVAQKWSNKFIPACSLLCTPENDTLRYNVIRSSGRPSDWRRRRRAEDSKANHMLHKLKKKKSTTNLKSDHTEKATAIIISSSV